MVYPYAMSDRAHTRQSPLARLSASRALGLEGNPAAWATVSAGERTGYEALGQFLLGVTGAEPMR